MTPVRVAIKTICWSLTGILLPFTAAAQPVLELEQYVNTNNGKFSYSVPLAEIPAFYGPSYPLTANYHSGIRVHQDAGTIGLGWSLPVGEIFRVVNGVPDDFKDAYVQYTNFDGTHNKDLYYYGPVHFSDFPSSPFSSLSNGNITETIMDVFENEQGLVFPNYDEFIVQTPFLSGRMKISLHNSGDLKQELVVSGSGKEFTYKSDDPINSSKRVMRFEDEKWAADPDNTSKNHGTRHVDFFLNSEIIQGGTGLLKPVISGGQAPRRVGSNLPDLIGGIIITDEQGYQYHFALPVYVRDFKSYSYPFDWNPNTAKWQPRTTAQSGSTDETTTSYSDKYATSWKLTAIVGPDFKDENGNNIPDNGDRGYWIRVDYGGWICADAGNSNFRWFRQAIPFTYGKERDGSRFQILPIRNYNYLDKEREFSGFGYKLNRTEQHVELYYPDKIATASHAACFFYKLRNDGHSFNTNQWVVPKLRLTRILVLQQEQLPLLGNDRTFAQSAFQTPPGSSGSGLLEDQQSNYSGVTNAIIAGVHFLQDYSLCKGIPNSRSNWNYSNTSANLTQPVGISHLYSLSSPANHATGGKLTLKKIQRYGIQNVPSEAPYVFSYDYNPIFDPKKVDRWGYYHKHKNGWFTSDFHYPSSGDDSQDHTDAWNLTGIRLPGGSNMDIAYESNEFTMGWSNSGESSKPREYLFVRSYNNGILELYEGAKTEGLLGSGSDPVYINLIDRSYCTPHSNADPVLYRMWANVLSSDFSESPAGNSDRFTVNATFEESCPGMNGGGPFDFGYIAVEKDKMYGFGPRVAQIRLTDASIGQDQAYQVDFTYEKGIGIASPSRFTKYGRYLRYNNLTASFLSLPSTIYYLSARANYNSGYGTSASIGSKRYTYGRPYKVDYSVNVDDCVPGRVFIPHFYTRVPMRWLADSIDTQPSGLPTYHGHIIPSLIIDLVNSSNMYVVGNYAPIGSSFGQVYTGSNHPTTYTDECGDWVTSNGGGEYPYYTEFYTPGKVSRSVHCTYNVGGFGRLVKVETLDSEDNTVASTTYRYTMLGGRNLESFQTLLEPENTSDPDIETTMQVRTDVVVLRGALSWSDKGVRDIHINSRNQYGQVKDRSTFISGEGTRVQSTSYMHQNPSYTEFRPKALSASNGNRVAAVSEVREELLKTKRPPFYTQEIPDGSDCLGLTKMEYGGVNMVNCSVFSGHSLPQDYPAIQIRTAHSSDCSSTAHSARKVTLVDHHYRPIETLNEITGVYSSIIRDYGDGTVIATVEGTRYRNIGLSGFEYQEDRGCGYQTYSTGINVPSASTGDNVFHTGTGKLSIQNSTAQVFWKAHPETGKDYRFSVWVRGNDPQIRIQRTNSGSMPPTSVTFTKSAAESAGAVTCDGWTLIEGTYHLNYASPPMNMPEVKVFFESPNGSGDFDDFRFYPSECSVEVIYPDRYGRPLYILDQNNFFTRLEYSDNVNQTLGRYQYMTTYYRETPLGEKKAKKEIINAE